MYFNENEFLEQEAWILRKIKYNSEKVEYYQQELYNFKKQYQNIQKSKKIDHLIKKGSLIKVKDIEMVARASHKKPVAQQLFFI